MFNIRYKKSKIKKHTARKLVLFGKCISFFRNGKQFELFFLHKPKKIHKELSQLR